MIESNDLSREEVSAKEIKEALFSLKDHKALSPDGYNTLFFKKSCSVVGTNVISAIKSFFDSGCLLCCHFIDT